MSSDGMELFQGGNSVSNFGSSVRLGKSVKSRVEISDTLLSMYDGQGTPRKEKVIFKGKAFWYLSRCFNHFNR